jgi:hypothetical protein
MAMKLQFTQDPYESNRANPPSGTIVGFKFKFQNNGDQWAQQGTYTNSWFAINNNTSDQKTLSYYPQSDMGVGTEYEDYIQLDGLSAGHWQLYVALDTSGQVALAGGGGADDGRTIEFDV